MLNWIEYLILSNSINFQCAEQQFTASKLIKLMTVITFKILSEKKLLKQLT